MDFSAWNVDFKTLSATHESGFRLEIEGSPKDPSAVHPGKFPPSLSGVEQVRLLRMGVEALASAVKSRPAAKPAYVAPANKPRRAILSLKKKQIKEA